MGRTADGQWSKSWEPPSYRVGEDGRIIGFQNDRLPNNWNRWGDSDQIGTLNFITPEIIRGARELIRSGRVVSMALPLDSDGPVHPGRVGGIVHLFSFTGSDAITGGGFYEKYQNRLQVADDFIFMPLQGSTQWDSLCHYSYKDACYNGYWFGHVDASSGARYLGIQNIKERLVGRGVLLDVPRALNLDSLSPNHAISVDELEECARIEQVALRPGDILIVRTGYLTRWYEADRSHFWDAVPGLSLDTAEWIYRNEFAAIAMDNASIEVQPRERPGDTEFPLHVALIRDYGMTLGEMFWLEDISRACAEEGRWEFFFTGSPLNITNGAGTPVNPIAVF
jgi:kynurenine formamidase